ncbi:MAG: EVE domain-containing protein [Gammaproteobacteria bacterium]|nr:EVE domain-containing protein [Gammaproteobacteria bacterium]
MPPRYWLMKSEPETYSIDDLKNEPRRIGRWDGVRNYQVRNFLRDTMQDGDHALFYHSGHHPGVAGIMRIRGAGYPDPTAFDPQHEGYDPNSNPAAPRWYAIDVRYQRKLQRFIPLAALRAEPQLNGLQILRRGNRLSITPLSETEWLAILRLEGRVERG